jgi:nucleotide-binding universal stress UspA family protein
MKTIVFATDFSRGSRKAAQTAAQTAIKTGAKLILFHAYRYLMPLDSEMSLLAVSTQYLEEHAISSLKRLKNSLNKKFSQDHCLPRNQFQGLTWNKAIYGTNIYSNTRQTDF